MTTFPKRPIDKAHAFIQDPDAKLFINILAGEHDAYTIAKEVASEVTQADSTITLSDSKVKYKMVATVTDVSAVKNELYQYLLDAQEALPAPQEYEYASSVCRLYVVKGKLQLAYRIEITRTGFYVNTSVGEFTEDADRRQRDQEGVEKALRGAIEQSVS